ncbi:hypothetical protein [Ottowia testudinis]|uniref:Uncharacterized protein n=1 Tax=Ottowia testudinis TaxID=2816950 RepID=A0A975CHP3_9BURK|nr:hypothetical protein [Ottowia testudinis]QTD46390.1 hypothetical protein J1M35_05740 [Ottowia testudinis]
MIVVIDKISLFVLLMFGGIWMQNAKAQSYNYVNPSNSKMKVAIQIAPPVIAVNDRAVDAVFCKDQDAYSCFSSEWLSFAVPKKMPCAKNINIGIILESSTPSVILIEWKSSEKNYRT